MQGKAVAYFNDTYNPNAKETMLDIAALATRTLQYKVSVGLQFSALNTRNLLSCRVSACGVQGRLCKIDRCGAQWTAAAAVYCMR